MEHCFKAFAKFVPETLGTDWLLTLLISLKGCHR